MSEERDPRLSQRYRELGAEEPSAELDAAILAAARRSTARRLYAPLAAAAVLVLGIAVAVLVERDRPDPQSAMPMQAPAPAVSSEALREERKAEAPASAPARGDRALARQGMAEPPEKWLERIAGLRRDGRHEQADRELAAFRKRYPDFEIPDPARAK